MPFKPGTSGNPKGPKLNSTITKQIRFHHLYWNTKRLHDDVRSNLIKHYGYCGVLGRFLSTASWTPPDDRYVRWSRALAALATRLQYAEKLVLRYTRRSRKDYFRMRYVGNCARASYPKANHKVLLPSPPKSTKGVYHA